MDSLGPGTGVSFAMADGPVTLDGMTSRYVDLSHPIQHEMITYPGWPGPTIVSVAELQFGVLVSTDKVRPLG